MNVVNYITTLVVSFISCMIFTRLIIQFCHRFHIFDYPGKHKRHKQPTPFLGGTAVLISIWLGIGVFIIFGGDDFSELKDFLPNILAGSLLIYLVGLIDDFKPLAARLKLAVQLVAGLILYYGGMSIDFVSLPGTENVALDGYSVFLTVFWVVALSNAINIIDGLDGLAVGVSVIAATSLIIIGFLFSIESAILISLALGGSLVGFWIFNRYPAKIFLGDSGSLLIGYFFAVISLAVPIKSFATAALFTPLVVLGVPLTETFSSFFRRLVAGKSVMKADRRHIFHYLFRAGLTHKNIVNLFYLSGLFFGALSIAMALYYRVLVLTILILFMVVIFIIYLIFIGRIRKRLENRK